MGAVTSRQGEVRVPRSQIGQQSDTESGFLNAFVKLKEMRMALTDTDPDYFHYSFRRKGSYAFDRQEKRAKLDRV